jgi:hypothetical protein
MEACRIGIHYRAQGVVDVGAPMKHKELCYDILRDARTVLEALPDQHFGFALSSMTIVMNMSGTVDVAAPFPPRQIAYQWLNLAKSVIERYDDAVAPEMRPFDAAVMGGA